MELLRLKVRKVELQEQGREVGPRAEDVHSPPIGLASYRRKPYCPLRGRLWGKQSLGLS